MTKAQKKIVFICVMVFLLMTSISTRIPTYAERHRSFNRLVDENPWIKIYIAAILFAEAIACYLFATSKHIDVIEILDGVGIFGLLGALVLVFLPFIIIRLRELYTAAGR